MCSTKVLVFSQGGTYPMNLVGIDDVRQSVLDSMGISQRPVGLLCAKGEVCDTYAEQVKQEGNTWYGVPVACTDSISRGDSVIVYDRRTWFTLLHDLYEQDDISV